jgi:hypothetical protein
MGETNSPSVAHVGYDISPHMEKYRNPHGQLKHRVDKSFSEQVKGDIHFLLQ